MGTPGFKGGDRGPPQLFSKGGPSPRRFGKGGPTSAVAGGIKKKPRDPNARNGIRNARRARFTADEDAAGYPHQQQNEQQRQQNVQRREKIGTQHEGSAGGAYTRNGGQASAPQQRPWQEAEAHPPKPKQQQQQEQRGEQLSRAVFVRNLPFDADEASVSLLLGQFGSLKKTFLVKNELGEGKGVAFVYFDDAASAQKAIAASAAYESELNRLSGRQQKRLTHLLAAKREEERQQQAEAEAACGSNLFFKGRRVQILPALNRDQAKTVTLSKLQERHCVVLLMRRAAASASKRGLPLAFEGLPRRPFDNLGPSEEFIANAAYAETKEKLKNPNIFVNKNRLCVRNLPNWADANFLREKISGLLAPILKTHAASPSAAAAAAIAAAAAAAHSNEPQQHHQQQQQQQRSQGDVSNMKEWRQKASAAITKATCCLTLLQVAIIREKRGTDSRRKASSSGTPRRSLGFCFVDLNCDFAQTLQLVHAVRDSRGFFDNPLSSQRKDTERKPIVQFALEDARKVKIRTERIEAFAKLLKKRRDENGEENQKPGKTFKTKKYSRGQRQREKRRQQRLAAEQAAATGGGAPQQKQREAARPDGKMSKRKEQRQMKITQRQQRGLEKNLKGHTLLEQSSRFVEVRENSRRKRKKRADHADKEDLEVPLR
ncbi:hypothetical protein Esti_003989 [Eimeria stiedai]